jgi:hypothetical protein
MAVAAARAQEVTPTVVPLLVCQARGSDEVVLDLTLLNGGRRFAEDPRAQLGFLDPTAGGRTFEGATPGPRTAVVPVATSAWSGDQAEVLTFGPFTLAGEVPGELLVRGGLEGEAPTVLGTLVRPDPGAPGQGVRFVRAWPGVPPPAGRCRIWVTAVATPVDDGGGLMLKVAYANCGEAVSVDHDAFLHVETEPTGEHLDRTTAMGLYPMAVPTDSASWSASELTVVAFGPLTLPAEAPEVLYLRAGLYDHRGGRGSGKRLPLVSPDDSDRALVGRLVTRAGRTHFERIFMQDANREE